MTNDSVSLSRDLTDVLRQAEHASRSESERPKSPLLYYRAALISHKLGNAGKVEKYSEQGLAELAAFSTDIANRIYDSASLGFYTQLQTKLTELMISSRLALKRVRPSRQWMVQNLPQLMKKREAGQDRKAAEQVIRRWRDAYTKNWDYRDTKHVLENPPHLALARAYRQVGNYDQAIIEGLAAVESGDNQSIAWSFLGWTYMSIGALDRAAEAFENASKEGDRESGILAARLRDAYSHYLQSMKKPNSKSR